MPIDSLATLLVAVAQADGPVDRKELDTIDGQLQRLFRKAPPGRSSDAIQKALEHLILQVSTGVEMSPLEWIRHHCGVVAQHYDHGVRRALVKELVSVAKASGGASGPEVELAAGIAGEWGHEELGTTMLRQWQRAQQRRVADR